MNAVITGNQTKYNQEKILQSIVLYTRKSNVDNISRTKAYLQFYRKHPEIRWAFLASMVSRNAGWNMCDLEGEILPKALTAQYRQNLFLTYERANYLIFKDVFPQLLVYEYSMKYKQPLFHLLQFLPISSFIREEWEVFWRFRDMQRLMTSLIINEQNIIQKPVIESSFFQKQVFQTRLFILQDMLHFSTVLFPTMRGELFGASVHQFKNITARIQLGKRLAAILFSEDYYSSFLDFAVKTEHTGSRRDYEQYSMCYKQPDTPFLRMVFPIVKHQEVDYPIWDQDQSIKRKWINPVGLPNEVNISSWYAKKQKQIRLLMTFSQFLNHDIK